jgi:hypothetical protein
MTTSTTRRSVPVSSSSPEVSHRGNAGLMAAYDDDFQDDPVLSPESLSLGPDHLAERVQTTQQRLSLLRAEADALEREKLQMEELGRKQREFMGGRTEVAEKLSRSIAMLDRESYEAQKRVEQLLVIKDSFHQHLEMMQSLNPEEWNSQELPRDLTRAIGIIEDAREEYAKSMARVQLLTNASASTVSAATVAVTAPARDFSAASRSGGLPIEISREAFRSWAFCGAAFSLPLIALAAIYMLVRLITG